MASRAVPCHVADDDDDDVSSRKKSSQYAHKQLLAHRRQGPTVWRGVHSTSLGNEIWFRSRGVSGLLL